MDLGNVGAPEFLLLLLLGLMLFGPADLVRLARRLGYMLGRLQRFWAENTQVFNEALNEVVKTTEQEDSVQPAAKEEDGSWRIAL